MRVEKQLWAGLGWAVLACAAQPSAPPQFQRETPTSSAPNPRDTAAGLVREGDIAASHTDDAHAVKNYQKALELDPDNAETLWKLSRVYDRNADWVGVNETLTRAVQLAPRETLYWWRLGNALIQLGKAGDETAYEAANERLSTCVELMPSYAQCRYMLGITEEWSHHSAAAAEQYRAAVALMPGNPIYAAALASLYGVFRKDAEAEGVLADAAAHISSKTVVGDDTVRLSEMWAKLALARGDAATARAALTPIEDAAGWASPELAFKLAEIYATPAPVMPLDAPRAFRAINAFFKRTCRGRDAARFKNECEMAQSMVQTLPAVEATQGLPPGASRPTPVPMLPPPKLEVPTMKSGDAFTVAGVSYLLRSPQGRALVLDKRLPVTGYIIKTNLSDAPRCAVHRGGIGDPAQCRAAIPTFWLADSLGAPLTDCIRVMGWASNYANIYDAIRAFDSAKRGPYIDEFWGTQLPNPLPAAGAKVTVVGRYGRDFTKATSGFVTDDVMGILSYESMQELEPSLELATLPGVKRKR